MLTHDDMQGATDGVVSAANMVRAVYKLPPRSPLGPHRTVEKQQEAVSRLVDAREQYRRMSQDFVAQAQTRGNHTDAMLRLDSLIAKHLDGYDQEFCLAAPDYNAGEIDWFKAAGEIPQVSDLPTEEQEVIRQHDLAYRRQLAEYPPVGWGESTLTYTDRVSRWRARPLGDRLGDLRPRDIREWNIDTAVGWSAE